MGITLHPGRSPLLEDENQHRSEGTLTETAVTTQIMKDLVKCSYPGGQGRSGQVVRIKRVHQIEGHVRIVSVVEILSKFVFFISNLFELGVA